MINYIGQIKGKTQEPVKLYNKLQKYYSDISKVDSQITNLLAGSLIVVTTSFDRLPGEERFTELFFDNTSPSDATFFLNKLQNNIRINENKIIFFCNERCRVIIEDFNSYSAIVGSSSSVVRPGETIEITAGIGAFSTINHPVITINYKPAPLNESGYALYQFKSPGKAGRYHFPVKFEFTDHDGKRMEMEKTVEYTVTSK